MIALTQNIKTPSGSLVSTLTHIFSPLGHFERDEVNQGWHIQLGTEDSADHYLELITGEEHEVPESLPDIILEDEEATEEDYREALAEMGVQIDEKD